MSPSATFQLPPGNSPDLVLDHPTEEEKLLTWDLNSVEWNGGLSKEIYLEREQYLTKAPLARDGGITHWVLVQKGLPPNQRPLLASSESIRKSTIMSKGGHLSDVISHGIGSVFCNPEYRGRGYGTRMMNELGNALRTWQTSEEVPCAFSALWSDIGKNYYAGFGWHPFPSTHIEFPPLKSHVESKASILRAEDLQQLCEIDEKMVRQYLAKVSDGKTHVAMLPDHDQIQWHHVREDFMCKNIYNRQPEIRGAVAGEKGHRVWAIFTRSFYGPLEPASGNTLHILRVVIEDEASDVQRSTSDRAEQLKGILQIAQTEAAEWKLKHVELWNPTTLLQQLVELTGLEHGRVERQKDSIPSLMWYGKGSGKEDEIEWVGNEKYVWC